MVIKKAAESTSVALDYCAEYIIANILILVCVYTKVVRDGNFK